MTMPFVIMGSTLLACPLMVTLLLKQDNFWLSLVLLAGHYSVVEAWYSPAITMVQNTTSVKN